MPPTPVLGVPLHAMTEAAAVQRVATWAQAGEARRVCFVNAHSAVTAGQDATFARAIAGSDLNLPDGAPVAWMLRRLGHARQPRVSGPDFMAALVACCAATALPVYLLGSTPATLEALGRALQARWPALLLVGARSPSFGTLSPGENDAIVQTIGSSGARVVFVGLGCPKQELWMAEHSARLPLVMLGVGAAFDFHAGTLQRAPRWMRNAGLEWLHRVAHEPRRLAWRYLRTNILFMLRAAAQLVSR